MTHTMPQPCAALVTGQKW